MNILDVNDVSKQYARHLALDRVSLSVREGVIFGLLGPNGAGKTTLIRILNQIIYPDSGNVLFKGKPLSADDVRQIGYLPEERGLYKKMKAGEQALYLARLKGMDRMEALTRLHHKFEEYGILDWWNRPVEELSKGMQQKVQFITTTIHQPAFLILDEPFSGFDPINANLLKEEILKLKASGTTIILSTLNHAQKILDGNLFEIKNRFKKNIFAIEVANEENSLADNLQHDFEVIQRQALPHSIRYDIRLPEDKTANDLLNACMRHSDILSFHETLPSMNEIFIEQVEHFNRQCHEKE